ncbi:MAG TPA: hypothetical protein VFC84_13040 [Desulfosporosinus sp.]|nr:hypothetical protein [Desulfosporosinus sp.]
MRVIIKTAWCVVLSSVGFTGGRYCAYSPSCASRYAVNDPVLEKRGILVRVHEASYRFLFFWFLSAKMSTKIVRVATFSVYNP